MHEGKNLKESLVSDESIDSLEMTGSDESKVSLLKSHLDNLKEN